MGELGRAGGQAGMGRKMGREGKGGGVGGGHCMGCSAAARHCRTETDKLGARVGGLRTGVIGAEPCGP